MQIPHFLKCTHPYKYKPHCTCMYTHIYMQAYNTQTHIHTLKHTTILPKHTNTQSMSGQQRCTAQSLFLVIKKWIYKFIIYHDFLDRDGPVCTPTSFGLAAKCQQCIRSLPHLNNHIWSWLWTFLLKASYMPLGVCAQVNPWIVPMRFSTLERSVPFSSLMPQPHLHIEPSRMSHSMSHARWCLQKSADIQKNPSCTVIWTL